MRKFTSRTAKVGLTTALVFVVLTSPLLLIGMSEKLSSHLPLRILSSIGHLLTLPSLPVVVIAMRFYTPADSPTISFGNYVYLGIHVFAAAIFWGLVAALLTYYGDCKRENGD